MKLLARYILKELLVPLGVWVAFLFLLLFVMQFLRGTDVLLGSAITGPDFIRLLVYLGPHFLVMALPIAFLLAVLLGIGRLAEDRELTALQALGVSPLQFLLAPVLIALALGGLILLLAFTAEPWGLVAVKGLVNDVIKKNVVGDVRAGVFYEDLTNLTLYAQGVDPKTRQWRNVLIHDDRDPDAPLLVLAHEGQVNAGGVQEALRLALSNGQVHRASRTSDEYTVITFERGEIAVGAEASVKRRNRFRTPSAELTPGELMEVAAEARREGRDDKPFLMAMHSRLGLTLAPLAFALFGTPLALGKRQGGRARGYLLALGGYVVFYLLTRVFENLGQHGKMPFLLAGQLANGIYMMLGALTMWRVVRTGASR